MVTASCTRSTTETEIKLTDVARASLAELQNDLETWLASDDPVVVANALIVLIQRTTALLHRQMESLEEAFVRNGGIREKMHKARTEAVAAAEHAPACPECGKPMRRRRSAKGPFWGCSGYPDCKGTRPCEGAP